MTPPLDRRDSRTLCAPPAPGNAVLLLALKHVGEFRQATAANVHCQAPVTGPFGSEISRLSGREGGIGKSRISSGRPSDVESTCMARSGFFGDSCLRVGGLALSTAAHHGARGFRRAGIARLIRIRPEKAK